LLVLSRRIREGRQDYLLVWLELSAVTGETGQGHASERTSVKLKRGEIVVFSPGKKVLVPTSLLSASAGSWADRHCRSGGGDQ